MKKNQIFKMLSVCMVIMMLITTTIPFSAFATSNTGDKTSSYIQDGYYRIQHVGSGKYVDVSEVSMNNGAILHIWDRAEGNQNQIFKISRNSNGTYTIIANHSKKAIEVRNSSMDDWGEVAQWDYAGIPCQQWYINRNNGYYTLKNAYSKLNLNVKENKRENGTPLIQYHSDNTSAEQFNLIRMKVSDISSALFETNPTEFNYDSIKYTIPITYNINNEILKQDLKSKNVNNLTYEKYGKLYYPSCNKPSLYQVIYLDFKTVNAIICNYKTNPSLAKQIASFALGQGESVALDNILSISDMIEFISILSDAAEKEEWNKFISNGHAAMDQYNGLCIRVYLNTEITKANFLDYEGVNGVSEQTIYGAHLEYKYSMWDGKSAIGNPIDGSSSYQYTNFDESKFVISPSKNNVIGNTSNNVKSKFKGEWTYYFK